MISKSDLQKDIKSMKLYCHVDRVLTELRAVGKDDDEPLSASELTPFDQLHYHGTESVDLAVERAKISADSSVLEIGSGLGGPARHIAATAGARVTALELQRDQNALASKLTARCALSEKVKHICGDFLTYDGSGSQFDVIASWLALYHIRERSQLLDRCCALLNPGGYFFAEDLYARERLTQDEESELATELFAMHLPDYDAYLQDLAAAGLRLETVEEMSDDWTEFTRMRQLNYRAQRARHTALHGEAVYQSMDHFYEVVTRHFTSGKLGGLRVVARKA